MATQKKQSITRFSVRRGQEKQHSPTTQTTTPLLEIEKSSVPVEEVSAKQRKGEKINVTTDVLDIVIDTRRRHGGVCCFK